MPPSSYSKKNLSRLFDESQLKDRLFVSFPDVVQFRTLQSCAVDAPELEIFNPNPHPGLTSNPDPKSAGLDVLAQEVLGQHVGHRWVNVNNTKARAKKDGSYQPNLILTNKQQRGDNLVK